MEKPSFNPFEYKGSSYKEINSGEILVETAGYVPFKKQIQNMVQAGIDLENFRKGIYDVEAGDDFEEDTFTDSLDSFDGDTADAMLLSNQLSEGLSESKRNKVDSISGGSGSSGEQVIDTGSDSEKKTEEIE